jgi:DNA repair exonuclease SbcCD nuclease subunit
MINNISNSSKKIFHLSDIHVMNVKDHEIFNHAIDAFFKSVQNHSLDYEDGLIVITGDIFDNWARVSSEAFLLVTKMLKKFRMHLHPIVIIPGNHDVPRYSNAVSWIEPIIEAISEHDFSCDDVYFSKKSEIFNFKGINFVHYCFLDNFAVDKSKMEEGESYIGLFHAPVRGSVNADGFIFNKKRYFSPSEFEGCDAVLMGDIHMRQTIPYGDNKKAYYSGSLYQLSMGETFDGHGYGILDVGDFSYSFVDIEPKRAFYNCEYNKETKTLKIKNTENKNGINIKI